MSLQVHVSSGFTRSFKRLPRLVQQRTDEKDQLFRVSPFHPQLRTHKLKGELDGFWSYRVDYLNRVLFRFFGDHEVIYYDIGTHEIYE